MAVITWETLVLDAASSYYFNPTEVQWNDTWDEVTCSPIASEGVPADTSNPTGLRYPGRLVPTTLVPPGDYDTSYFEQLNLSETVASRQDDVLAARMVTEPLGFTSWTGMDGAAWRLNGRIAFSNLPLYISAIEICRVDYTGGTVVHKSTLGYISGLVNNDINLNGGHYDYYIDVVDQAVTDPNDAILIQFFFDPVDNMTNPDFQSWYGTSFSYTGHGISTVPTAASGYKTALTLVGAMDEMIQGITHEASATLSTSTELKERQNHEVSAILTSRSGINAIPDVEALMVTNWNFETQDNDENAASLLGIVKQQYEIDFTSGDNQRLRVRFLVKNTTLAPISNFSPQLEVSLNGGAWEHCQDPGRISEGLISRPYFGPAPDDGGAEYTAVFSHFVRMVNALVSGVKPNRIMAVGYGHPGDGASEDDSLYFNPTLTITDGNLGSPSSGDSFQRVFLSNRNGNPVVSIGANFDSTVTYRARSQTPTWDDYSDPYGDGTPITQLHSPEDGTVYHVWFNGSSNVQVKHWSGSWQNLRELSVLTSQIIYGVQPSTNDEILVLHGYTDTGIEKIECSIVTTTTLISGFVLSNYDTGSINIHGHDSRYIEFSCRNIGTSLTEKYTYDVATDTLTLITDIEILPSVSAIDVPGGIGTELYVKDNMNYSSSNGITSASPSGLVVYGQCKYGNTTLNQVAQQPIKYDHWPKNDGSYFPNPSATWNGQASITNIAGDRIVSTTFYSYSANAAATARWYVQNHIWSNKYLDRDVTSQQLGNGTYASVNTAFMSWGSTDSAIGTIGAGEEVEVVVELSFDKTQFDLGEPSGLFQLRISDFDGIISPTLIPAEALVDLSITHEGSAQLDSTTSISATAIVGTTQTGAASLDVSATLTGVAYNPVFGVAQLDSSATLAAAGDVTLGGIAALYTNATITANGSVFGIKAGTAQLDTTTSIDAIGTIFGPGEVTGAAQFDITTSLNASAVAFVGSLGFLNAKSSIVANASVTYTGASNLNSGSNISAVAEKGLTGSSLLKDNFSLLSFKTSVDMFTQGEFNISCDLSAIGQIEKYATSELNAQALLAGAAVKGLTGASNLSSVSNLSAIAHLWTYGNSNLSSNSNLISNAVLIKNGSAIMQSSTSMVSQAEKNSLAAAKLSTTSQLLGTAGRILLGQSVLQCNSEMTANLTEFDSRDIIPFDLYIVREVSISLEIN